MFSCKVDLIGLGPKVQIAVEPKLKMMMVITSGCGGLDVNCDDDECYPKEDDCWWFSQDEEDSEELVSLIGNN